MAERGLEELDSLWMDEISGEMNIELMAALAQHSPSDLLVFDTPSRHLNHTYMWLPYLEELAADEDHPRTVVAVVPHISESWHGARAVVGRVPEETCRLLLRARLNPPMIPPEHGENAEKE